MSDKTNIAWCDSTWNWIIGCTKVSPGCANCYAEVSMPSKMFGVEWGDKAERRIAADATFNAPLKWHKKPWSCDECGVSCQIVGSPFDLRAWCHACGKQTTFHRRRVFSLSLGDWLDLKIPVPVLARALDIIRKCPGMDFLLCTKRPELWPKRKSELFWHIQQTRKPDDRQFGNWLHQWHEGIAPENVWILTSVEDQQRADERIPHLLRIPAVVRGLSVEPMLENIRIKQWDIGSHLDAHCKPFIHWVIVGGESGPKARPCNVEWVRSIVQQCQQAGTSFFVKQLGSRPCSTELTSDEFAPYMGRIELKHPKGGDPAEWPADLRVRDFPTVKSP